MARHGRRPSCSVVAVSVLFMLVTYVSLSSGRIQSASKAHNSHLSRHLIRDFIHRRCLTAPHLAGKCQRMKSQVQDICSGRKPLAKANSIGQHQISKGFGRKVDWICHQLGASRRVGRHQIKLLTKPNSLNLPECDASSPDEVTVCAKIDIYGKWAKQHCRCGPESRCRANSLHDKSQTVVDGSTAYKTCQPVTKLRQCSYFTDITRSVVMNAEKKSIVSHSVHCTCPPGAKSYLSSRTDLPYNKVQYNFVCSPPTRQKCKRHQPCRLFSFNQIQIDSDNDLSTSSSRFAASSVDDICLCPPRTTCPSRHTSWRGVTKEASVPDQSVQVYSAFCV